MLIKFIFKLCLAQSKHKCLTSAPLGHQTGLSFGGTGSSVGLQLSHTQQSKVVCEACSDTSWKEELSKAIKNVVAENNGNVSEAARQLGMSRTTIYKHLS